MKNLSSSLDKRITIQSIYTQIDSLGGESETVINVIDKCWAKAEPISNKKIRVNGESITETILFTIRPNKHIDLDQQILFQNRVFTVRAVDKTQRDRFLITAEADARHDRY